MITGWQKSQKMKNQTISDHLESLQNVAKVEHQYYGKIGFYPSTLDKIQEIILQMMKKSKALIKVEDFKVHHWQHSKR